MNSSRRLYHGGVALLHSPDGIGRLYPRASGFGDVMPQGSPCQGSAEITT